jgi:hypothetical protein
MLTLIFIQGLYDMNVSLFYQYFALLGPSLSVHGKNYYQDSHKN